MHVTARLESNTHIKAEWGKSVGRNGLKTGNIIREILYHSIRSPTKPTKLHSYNIYVEALTQSYTGSLVVYSLCKPEVH